MPNDQNGRVIESVLTHMDGPYAAYRSNVGIALFDHQGRVFIARRLGDDGPEIIDFGYEWQMPQGGIDPNEDVEAAARRELFEETGIRSVSFLDRLERQVTYDWPPYHGPPHRLARWRGQVQTWMAFRFVGNDGEIGLSSAAEGEAVEFDAWRWEKLDRLPDLVVPYKRAVYEAVAAGFARHAVPVQPPPDGSSGAIGMMPP